MMRIVGRAVSAVALAVSVCACGGQVIVSAPPRIALLSAFPAEMAPLLAQASIDHTEVVNDRVFRIGTLAGVPVVMGLTGIGLVNAATTTRAVLERFDVTGVVVSAVAGSSLQIGDVLVPEAWELKDGTTFASYQPWLQLAGEIAASDTVSLDRCTVRADDPTEPPVCMLEQPVIVVGGIGQSTDPFHDKPFPCQPTGGDIYGCDIPPSPTASELARRRGTAVTFATADVPAPIANDMETAAIAREAAARGLPFIAFRAVSDGAGDPLDLPPLFGEFPAYYRFAAHNGAALTVAFLERLAAQ
jgi:nucleoside phosphorylase